MHDTELCAHESGCSRKVVSRDLCSRHYGQEKRDQTGAPAFKRWLKGQHSIAQTRSDGLGFCVRCNAWGDFYTHKRGHTVCRQMQSAINRRSKTGWSEEEYDLALIFQGNRCKICGRLGTRDRPLHADHNHSTGSTRSLLCGQCNSALGLLDDNPELIRRCAIYLEGHL